MTANDQQGENWKAVKTARESSRDEIVSVYRALGGQVSDWGTSVRCVFHSDDTKSADIQFRGSKWYFKCHKESLCLDVWELEARLKNVSVQELLREKALEFSNNPEAAKLLSKPKVVVGELNRQAFKSWDDAFQHRVDYAVKRVPTVEVEGVYGYFPDVEKSTPEFVVVRLKDQKSGAKQFPQFHKSPADGMWYIETPPKELLSKTGGKYPLLNRQKVLASRNVIVFEGEWCVEHFERLGIEDFAGTCSPMGAKTGAVSQTYWQDLAGKNVYIWGDFDLPDAETKINQGEEYVKAVSEKVLKLTPPSNVLRIRIEELDLPPKGDIVDFLKSIADKSDDEKRYELMSVIYSAEKTNASSSLKTHYDSIISGEYDHIHFVNSPQLSRLTQAVTPASVVLICGNPGSSKSFWTLEQAWRWIIEGEKRVALLELEKDLEFWLKRAHAQMSGNSFLTDYDWVHENSLVVNELYEKYEEELDLFSRSISTMPKDKLVDLKWITLWMEEKAKEGARIIMVDPVTAAAKSDKAWQDDFDFMMSCTKIATNYKTTLILVTHPKNDAVKTGKPSLGDLAGGTAYYRFSDVVLWLKKHKEEQSEMIDISGYGGQESKTFKHELQIWKSRNGRGDGCRVATLKDLGNLCFLELGEILSD